MSKSTQLELAAQGFEIIETGGGCSAWRKNFTDGGYVLITCDASHEFQDDEGIVIGFYGKDDQQWQLFDATAIVEGKRFGDAGVLEKLRQADGAILYWQVDEPEAFASARKRGVIRLDTETDCYVHPDAVELPDGGYTMIER
jgi:hypothetical protein